MKSIFTRIICLLFAIGLMQTSASAISPLRPASGEPSPAVVKSAMESLKSLSKTEKNNRISQAKAAIKDHKEQQKLAAEPMTNKLLLVLITILIPPLGVYLHEGEINSRFWISLILTLLFYFPGLIYSLIVVLGD